MYPYKYIYDSTGILENATINPEQISYDSYDNYEETIKFLRKAIF